jgi:hypothetical protein
MLQSGDGVVPSGWLKRQQRRTRTWLRTALGIDAPIAFTVLARAWASAAGLITVGLIARFLSPDEQGYYYTFGSLVALQIVFELGFSFVILQMASHERAHLTITGRGGVEGDPVAHARLASVLQKVVRWYTVASLLLVGFLVIAGTYFFAAQQQPNVAVQWRLPWYAAALAASVAFQLDPLLSYMEGCGFVADVARVRFAQAALGSVLAWAALISHHGLFAPALMIAGSAAVSCAWLFRWRKLLLGLFRFDPGPHRIRWQTEVWTFQWRIAVSWLCGYFIFQLYNPVLFSYKGAVAAGQMGMSLSLANALQSVAVSWVNTKAAPFGSLIARRQYAQLDKVFFSALRQSFTVCAAGAFIIWLAAIWMNWAHLGLAHRILDPASLGILLFTTLLNTIVWAEATYLRAHKQEKFLQISILGAILVGCSTYFLGKTFGAFGMVTGSLLIGVFMGLPLGTYTFLKYRRQWHAN